MPSDPVDRILYGIVKAEADRKFTAHGVYKSSWIVREYKKRGGLYVGRKNKDTGLLRWFREEWIDLNRSDNKPCGRSDLKAKYPLCRPSKRITNETPKTIAELSKKSIDNAKKNKGNGKPVRF
jgi:hypothetical protein